MITKIWKDSGVFNYSTKISVRPIPNIRYRIFGQLCRYADNGKWHKIGDFWPFWLIFFCPNLGISFFSKLFSSKLNNYSNVRIGIVLPNQYLLNCLIGNHFPLSLDQKNYVKMIDLCINYRPNIRPNIRPYPAEYSVLADTSFGRIGRSLTKMNENNALNFLLEIILH